MGDIVSVKSIYTYPVKSMGPIELQEARVAKKGLKGDRRWILLDSGNQMVTQREFPELSFSELYDRGDTFEIKLRKQGDTLFETTTLPKSLESGHTVKIQVWDDEVDVTLYNGPANDVLSSFLGSEFRFAFQMDEQVRKTDPRYSRAGDEVSLADGYPILIVNQKSLDDLNSRLERPIDMMRFRPNIVLDGDLEAFEEDHWIQLENETLSWRVVKPCARCSITTISNQGKFSKEPLRTLSTYRKRGSKVMFGMNVISDHSGEIKVGDKLNVVRSIVASDHG